MNRHDLGRLFLLTLPLWLCPLASWMVFTPWSVSSWLGFILLLSDGAFLAIAFGALSALVFGPIFLFIPSQRRRAAGFMLQSVVYLASFLAGFVWGMWIRDRGVHDVMQRGGILIAAIGEFEKQTGRVPQSLEELVPRFLPSIPSTGVGLSPEFEYSRPRNGGKWWTLFAAPRCHPANSIRLVYYPNGNYPEHGFGGVIHRWGDWGSIQD